MAPSIFFWLEELPLCIKSSFQCSDHHSISNQARVEIGPCMEDLVYACVFSFHESREAACLWTDRRSLPELDCSWQLSVDSCFCSSARLETLD